MTSPAQGVIFATKSFCDFNDDPKVPELEEFTDEDEPEMEDLSLRDRSPDHSTRHSLLRSLLTTTLTQWLRAPTIVIKQQRSSANIAACVNNWITNFSAHTALASRTTVEAFRIVNFRFANDQSAHSAVINERNIQLLRTRRSVIPDSLERKASNLHFVPSIVTLLQDSAPFCLLKRRRLQQHRSYLRSLMLEWMAQVADVSLRTAIIVGLVYEQYNTYLADLLQAWRLHLPYYPNHVMFIEFRCQQLRRALHSCHNAYLSSLLQIWLQRAQTLPAISQLNLTNSGSPCNDVPLRGHHDNDDDDANFPLCEITHTLLQLSQTNREFLPHASFIDWGDSAVGAPCSKWKQICSAWDSASNTCLINPNLIRSHWKWASRAKRLVTGVGGKQTECYGIVIVPIMSTFAGDIDEKLMPKDLSWKIPDQFIVYDAPARLSGGFISTVDSDSTTVHDYMPIVCKTCVTWAPLWKSTDDPDADPIRSTKCPHSCSKSLVTVPDVDVISAATLKGRRLDDDSVARLKAI